MAAADQAFMEKVFAFKTNPLAFVLWAFPWGEPGTDLAEKELESWQRDVLIELGKFLEDFEFRKTNKFDLLPFLKAVASGHGIGKSALIAMLIIFFMSTRRNCRGIVTANTGDQLSTKTWPELQKWHARAINKHWFKWTAEKFKCLMAASEEEQENWRFDAVTWSEERTEAFAGLHNENGSILFFDEGSAISNKIFEVSEGVLVDPLVVWLVFGNPTRNTGRFRECFGKLRALWRPQHIDSRTCKMNAGKAMQYKQWIESYGDDSDFVRVRIKGQFPNEGDKQFISSKAVEDAQTRDIPHDAMAPLIMGVDPARANTDKFVVRFRRGRDGRSIPAFKFLGMKTQEQVHRVADLIGKFNPDAVCIDTGGGYGLIDGLRALGYRVHAVDFGVKLSAGQYANTRVKLWGDMRDWLEGAMIDADQELFDDLIGPEFGFSGRDGDQYLLESKESMKLRGLDSPDDADALACTFAVNVARRDLKTARYSRRAVQAKGLDYDPLAA